MKSILRVALLFFSFSLSANAQDEATLRTRIDSLAGEQLKQTDGIGFIVGIYVNGEKHFYSYGANDPGTRDRADTSTIFEIGPLSETFTVVTYARLTIDGKIGYDDPLQKYLPVDVPSPVYQKIICSPMKDAENPFGIGDERHHTFTPYVCVPDASEKPQPILICYLATHTSGLPEYPQNLKTAKDKNDPFSRYSRQDLYDFLKNYSLLEPIGYDYRHSPLGISLLGHVLALHEKKSFEDVVTDNLLRPLGMTNTGIGVTENIKYKFINGYNPTGKSVPHWTYDVLAPSGAFHSSMGDMMRFLEANIGGKNELKNVLDYTHNPRVRLNDHKTGLQEIALGWKVSPLGIESSRITWQGGITGGFASYVGFVETSHCGVVILSNCSVPLQEFGQKILQVLNK